MNEDFATVSFNTYIVKRTTLKSLIAEPKKRMFAAFERVELIF